MNIGFLNYSILKLFMIKTKEIKESLLDFGETLLFENNVLGLKIKI